MSSPAPAAAQESPPRPSGAVPRKPERAAAAIAWIGAFAAAEYFFSMRELAAIVPGTVLRLISIPLALLAVALMLRPARQAPIYGLIYAAIILFRERGAPHLEFSAVRIAIETFEMMFIVSMLYRFFFHRFADPVVVGVWAMFVLSVSALAALLMVAAAGFLPTDAPDYMQALGGSLGIAWRNWWLGGACSFLALAGPAATLVNLRHRFRLLITGVDRGRFVALTLVLAATSLFAFRLADMPWFGFPADVILAVRLLPVPFAMAMAARFRANGAAVAILIVTLIGAYSATVGGGERAWQATPLPATPRQTLILITTITCMVLAGISRQLRRALRDAVEAAEVKSRFIALMSHELRTPLNAILGFSELMRLKNIRDMDEAIGPIENIHASGQRLLAMIEGLLNQADRGAGVFEIHRQHVGIRQAVDDAISEINPQLGDCPRVEIVAPEDIVIEADPKALKQILVVLLSYPMRFCGPDTSATVVVKRVGTDTVVEVASAGLINAVADGRDKIEVQLVNAIALAHGARLKISQQSRDCRVVRLTFFATHAH